MTIKMKRIILTQRWGNYFIGSCGTVVQEDKGEYLNLRVRFDKSPKDTWIPASYAEELREPKHLTIIPEKTVTTPAEIKPGAHLDGRVFVYQDSAINILFRAWAPEQLVDLRDLINEILDFKGVPR